MRTGEGIKVELWLHPVDHYPDTAVVVRRDNDHRIKQGRSSGSSWPAVLLAVVKTKATNLPAFDLTSKSDLVPSAALLEVLRESYLVTAKVADPSDAQDLLPELGPAARIQAPEIFLRNEEPGGAYVPLNERHGHAHNQGHDS